MTRPLPIHHLHLTETEKKNKHGKNKVNTVQNKTKKMGKKNLRVRTKQQHANTHLEMAKVHHSVVDLLI